MTEKFDHNADMNERIRRVHHALLKNAVEPDDELDVLEKKLGVYVNWEEYLVKSRQANHPTILIYGPLFTSVAGVLIAIAVASVGMVSSFSQFRKDQSELVLRVVQASDQDNIASNLTAFRAAGLIRLSPENVKELSDKWRHAAQR